MSAGEPAPPPFRTAQSEAFLTGFLLLLPSLQFAGRQGITLEMTKLAIDGVVKTFGAVRAVDGVSLQVAEGETVVLLGPSGCGKTTLLRLIAGFYAPRPPARSASTARLVASPTVMVPPERRSLSMVFQSYAVWPHKTVFENLAYGLRLRRLDRTTIDRKVADALATVRMDAYATRYPARAVGRPAAARGARARPRARA